MNFKKAMIKAACFGMSAVLLCSGISASACIKPSKPEKPADYTISNPYENIDWSTVNQYKTALHTHTNATLSKSRLSAMLKQALI